MDYEILDEVLNFLNTGNINLNHSNFSNYDKLSHKDIDSADKSNGFYIFHRDIEKVINSYLKPYNLSGKLFGVYFDKFVSTTRMATIVIQDNTSKDYELNVEKFKDTVNKSAIINKLNKVSPSKVSVASITYCYTKAYNVYSIDVVYKKK